MLRKSILGLMLATMALPAYADTSIALIGPFTGKSAVFGEQMKRGGQQAVTDINAAGGINGQKITLRMIDDACDPKQAVTAANQAVSDGIKFVAGHYCSGSALPASKIYMDENILLVSPAATNPRLTDEAKDLVFRVCGRDDRQGGVVGHYIAAHFHDKKIAIAQDHSALVSKLKLAGVQVLFIGGYHTETGLIARQLKEQGMAVQIIGGDALVTDELWSIAGSAGEGILMSFGPDARSMPDAKQPMESLRKAGFEPEGYTLYSYAAVQVVAEAIRRGGNKDALAGAKALRQTPVKTVLSSLAFDAKGDVTGPGYVMYRWHDGKYVEVKE